MPGLAQVLVVLALAGVGAFVQGATGLGYGLVVAPGLFAALEPRQALYAGLCSAIVVNTLMLSGAKPVVRRRRVVTALAWGVPGLIAGAAVVGRISRPDLQVAVGIAVVVAVLVRAWHPGVIAEGPRRTVARAVAGLTAGALTTTISSNGPPLALWLDAEGVGGREMRDTLQVLFLAFNVAGLAALAFHELPAGPTAVLTALLLPGLVAGLVLGSRIAPRLAPATARWLALGVICATGARSVLAGLL